MTTTDLASASLNFWSQQVSQLASFREAYMAAGRPDWAAKLEPMHALALRRYAEARADWYAATDADIWLFPAAGFWQAREDIG